MSLRVLGTMCRASLGQGVQSVPRGVDLMGLVGPCLRDAGGLRHQARSLATRIEAPLEGDEFFNRAREVNAVRGVLRKSPQLSVFTGPVNSGKTSLILKNLKEESDSGRAVLHLDLRDRSFRTVEGFVPALEEEFISWRNRFFSVAKGINLDLEGYGIKAEVSMKSSDSKPIDRLDALFKKMSDQLPPGNIWRGWKTPILFIDEANKLKTLLDDPVGHGALLSFFDWMVKNTKQIRRFHIVLASSDSFFHLWISQYIGKSFFESYVIGDLPKDEAKRFWEERVVTSRSLPKGFNVPKFEEAYDACGGNLFFLRNYFEDSLVSFDAEFPFSPDGFPFVQNERRHLFRAFHRDAKNDPKVHWTRDQFIGILRALISTEQRFLIYDELVGEYGADVVDSMIAHNILHLRPTNRFAYDLDAPEETPIVSAESPAALYAMRSLLKQVD